MSKKVRNSGSKIMITAGAPMIIFMLGGSYALSNFMQTHYDLKDKAKNSTTTRKFDLEEEHSKMMKQLHVEDFSLSRIPRPDELDAAAVARKEARESKKRGPNAKAAAPERAKIDSKGDPTEEGIEDSLKEKAKKGWLY